MKKLLIVAFLSIGAFGLLFFNNSTARKVWAAENASYIHITSQHMVTHDLNTLSSSDPILTPTRDPDLKLGFPVQTPVGAGTYHGGPAINVTVANIDADPRLEIIVSALAHGPLYAWYSDGQPVEGWPLKGTYGPGYFAAGTYSIKPVPVNDIISGYMGGNDSIFIASDGYGNLLPKNWPINITNYIAYPPAMADIDGDGVDEIFTDQEDYKLHGYKADGTVLPGWPTAKSQVANFGTPAIADLDGNSFNGPEVVAVTGSTSQGTFLYAYYSDGTIVKGFPVNINPYGNGFYDNYPVIADVDGDGKLDIILINQKTPGTFIVQIFSRQGILERTITGGNFNMNYPTAPALADLDCDSSPDIIVQSDDMLYAWKGNGDPVAGWPIPLGSGYEAGNSSPVVGDIDGDGLPDVVITLHQPGTFTSGEVRAYDRHGHMLSKFPKILPIGAGGVPAIADIDADGRTDLIVAGDYWSGIENARDKVWAYDLKGKHYGRRLDWPQFGGGPKHTNYLPPLPPSDGVTCDAPWPNYPAR